MAPPGALSGQTALCVLVPPTVGGEAPETAIDTLPIPVQLRIPEGHAKGKKGTRSGILAMASASDAVAARESASE